jgi:6-pyruvoyltetrahydropterin/6-carboxytetrahydropterin synthase
MRNSSINCRVSHKTYLLSPFSHGTVGPLHKGNRVAELFRITREIGIDAAHRVPTHGSKCFNAHGHRYQIHATCEGALIEQGVQQGMVLDFGFLKDEMMQVIDTPCDHAAIFWDQDPFLHIFRECCGKLVVVPFIPTAENLARYWFDGLMPRVTWRSGGAARLTQIKVFETPNCSAVFPAI